MVQRSRLRLVLVAVRGVSPTAFLLGWFRAVAVVRPDALRSHASDDTLGNVVVVLRAVDRPHRRAFAHLLLEGFGEQVHTKCQIQFGSAAAMRLFAEQIPAVSFEIAEYGEFPVRFDARRRHEFDACVDHAAVRRVEIVDA